MNRKQPGFTLVEAIILFIYCVVVPAAVFGWGWNIYKIATNDLVFSGLMIVRVIGVFVPPVGAIVGYF